MNDLKIEARGLFGCLETNDIRGYLLGSHEAMIQRRRASDYKWWHPNYLPFRPLHILNKQREIISRTLSRPPCASSQVAGMNGERSTQIWASVCCPKKLRKIACRQISKRQMERRFVLLCFGPLQMATGILFLMSVRLLELF